MVDQNSSFTIVRQNPLDMAVSKNLEGLELAKRKKVVERKNGQINTVLHYLKNKLPHGNVDLKLVNSLPAKEFKRFLVRARWANVWGIAWPGVISVAFCIVVLNISSKSLLFYFISLPIVVFLLAGILFSVRLTMAIGMTMDGVCIEKTAEKAQ